MKELSMSIGDFMEVQRGNLTYEELIKREHIAEKIMRDREMRTMTIFVMGSLMYCQSAMAATNLDKIDNGGNMLLTIVRKFGYWVCILMCIIEVIRSLMQGDTKSMGRIIVKYVSGFASFYFLPWIFDIIRDIFK